MSVMPFTTAQTQAKSSNAATRVRKNCPLVRDRLLLARFREELLR